MDKESVSGPMALFILVRGKIALSRDMVNYTILISLFIEEIFSMITQMVKDRRPL